MGFTQSELTKAPTSIRPSESVVHLAPHIKQNLTNNDRNTIDDMTITAEVYKWSTNEVYQYFRKKFPRQAHVFEDEEIDGEALSLLTPEVIIKRFKIKIGPALKISEHIRKMQMGLKDRS